MIFIVIGIDTRPEKRDDFLAGITRYCAQVRAEPGNLRFTCSEDVEEPNRFVVVANYADQAGRRGPRGLGTRAMVLRMAAVGGLTSPVDRVPGAARCGLVRDGRGTPRIGFLTGYRRPSSVARRTAA
jgi:Antibiotic biosynthesis monooxygenase